MTTKVKFTNIGGGRLRVQSDPAGITASGGIAYKDLLPGEAFTASFPVDTPTPIIVEHISGRLDPSTKLDPMQAITVFNVDTSATIQVEYDQLGTNIDVPAGGPSVLNLPGRQNPTQINPASGANFRVPRNDRILVWPTVQ